MSSLIQRIGIGVVNFGLVAIYYVRYWLTGRQP